MENQQIPPAANQLENFFNIAFDPATRAEIRQAAVWARICALCAFIGYAVALAVGLFGQADVSLSSNGEQINRMVRTSSMVGILISTVLGVIINYFLYRFATATVKGMDSMDSIKTNEGFDNLRIYFKVLGILLIIALSIMGLVVIFAVIGAALLRH